MPQNPRSLPSLAALQSFESAARLGSFTRAAAERHLSHSAISRNVQAVEHWCGELLFVRQGPRVTLTDAGCSLRARIGDPIRHLLGALNLKEDAPTRQPLLVLTLPSVASTWLLPRLARFACAHPRITLSVETGYDMRSLQPATPVAALRFGHFDRRGLHCRRLWSDRMVAVASPAWIAAHGADPSRWRGDQLLRHVHEAWPARLPPTSPDKAPGPKLPAADGHAFNDALLLTQAAAYGCGVAWVRLSLAMQFIGEERLERIATQTEQTDKAAWLVCREDHSDMPQVRAFFQWMLEESQRAPAY
ncbi:LysR substrate-binding domain-containing protein [Dyella sp.]|jgi:LysR family glycine cleavage system transcriptional activator|uniref:LysR substrate-binding domain-containing protein n=1 Tax=Dyella sp. TaxID=1869338 RepID=UPI002D78DD82|nr:LysR substrate-binding domain-containing protein [Dyella sp.]HET6432681.1 LysR substrate-binding domain-containing protein [Dyella sp.]